MTTPQGKAFELIKNNWLLIVQVLLAIGLLVAIYRGGKRFLEWLEKEPDFSEELQKPSQGQLSYDRSYYKGVADSLETEMRFEIFPDVEDVVESLEKMNSKADMTQLIISFGTRLRGPEWMGYKPENLLKWLSYYFSGSDLNEIKEQFNQYGIPF